jgi:hypothetical protein
MASTETDEKMRRAIKAAEREVPPGWAIAMVVFEPGSPTMANYIGNAPRHEMRAALAEVVARWNRSASN